jgi:autotransporter strand-loop-strand O-heptosyltransferase
MHNKAYLLYSDESYFDLVTACAASIRQFSELPILVYMLNSDKIVEVPNTRTIKWAGSFEPIEKRKDYIDRFDDNIYRLLIERPSITKHALSFYSNLIAYVDSDSISTKYVDRIFDFYPEDSACPYFVEGVYDYLHINGRGGADSRDDLSTTLEHPACELFGVDQYVRQKYRQTGYFVAGQKSISFIEEWNEMCRHPKVRADFKHYAPYHEETIANVLLWKYNQMEGLPTIYVNGFHEKLEFTGQSRIAGSWLKIPAKKEDLLFYHGEKNINRIYEIMHNLRKMGTKIVFIAPHLSTGGMPQFLLKRIQALKTFTNAEIYVIEHSFYGDAYVVQRDAIKKLIGDKFIAHFGSKMEIMDHIRLIQPDIVHIDEMSERLDADFVKELYSSNRQYRIVETCHNVTFKPDEEKTFHPDLYVFCSPYHEDTFTNMESRFVTIEYPIEYKKPTWLQKIEAKRILRFDISKKNVINVGLWTSGKNQGEGIEIARKYPDMNFHFIGNQAVNFKDYWEPLIQDLPNNVHIWGERTDIDVFLQAADIFMFNSTFECNPLALREAVSYGLPIIARNLPQYKNMFIEYLQPIDTNLNTICATYDIKSDSLERFALDHYNSYQEILKHPIRKQPVKIIQHFVNNPYLEIKGDSDSNFKVKFFDEKGCQYENTIKSNHWVKLNRQYFTNWSTYVFENDELIYENKLSLKNKKVFISIDSKSIGDTLAWIPYCQLFKEKHQCELIVSTFWNDILDYPEIEFIKPGEVTQCYAMYNLGWFYNENKEPELCNTIPLQKSASNILGLEFKEIRPKIKFTPKNNGVSKYITIATNSTSGCKFWTKEGWQEVINHLKSEGYKIVNVSKERNSFDNCYQIEDASIEATMNWIANSEYFIGLSSGLSWLAWSLGKKVVMISNFTKDDHEFTSNCIRITNTDVCYGCWNEKGIVFDKGDWLWCKHKNTERHFECHTSITADKVIKELIRK